MRFDVLTIFPEMFTSLLDSGVNARAHKKGAWQLHTWNPRDFTHDTHRTVDDRPYGGGPGMVMMAAPLEAALSSVHAARKEQGELQQAPVILLSPIGEVFQQRHAQKIVDQQQGAIFVCGRYEGIDQRFIDRCVTHQYSLGDFVLSGGELAAAVMMDSVVRLLPGVLNDEQSAMQDSFHPSLDGLLDSPHYTRPENYEGVAVPDVLLSGNHKHIAQWRREQSLRLSLRNRPDLLIAAWKSGALTKKDLAFLATLGAEPPFEG